MKKLILILLLTGCTKYNGPVIGDNVVVIEGPLKGCNGVVSAFDNSYFHCGYDLEVDFDLQDKCGKAHYFQGWVSACHLKVIKK